MGAAAGRRFTAFDVAFVEDRFDDGVRRTVVPPRIMIQIEPNRGDRPCPDIGAAPAAGRSHELAADTKIRVLHLSSHSVTLALIAV